MLFNLRAIGGLGLFISVFVEVIICLVVTLLNQLFISRTKGIASFGVDVGRTVYTKGLPFGFSKDKSRRIDAIGEGILSKNYDIICLQELWTKSDYKKLRNALRDTYPYYHYFYSGINGSGLCIFSKWPIEDTFYYQFAVNGFFHMVHHADWFGGKGVGLARININGFIVNVYTTHLHANYSEEGQTDHYFAHRFLQSFDTAAFIRHTAPGSDMAILAGDLNIECTDRCYGIIRAMVSMEDTWEVAEEKESVPETCDCLRNSYRSKGISSTCPGKRIDFILFKAQQKYHVTVPECKFPFPPRIPGTDISYSDHEAVGAKFICISQGDSEINLERMQNLNEHQDSLPEYLCYGFELCHTEILGHIKDIMMFWIYIIVVALVFMFIQLFNVNHCISVGSTLAVATILCFILVLIFTRWQDFSWFKNAKKRFKISRASLKALPTLTDMSQNIHKRSPHLRP